MTELEFSNEMDVIYENINKGGAVGLDAYEKSVILTMAAEKVGVELIKADLASVPQLVVTQRIPKVNTPVTRIDQRSTVFELPADYVSIITETAEVADPFSSYMVLPLLPIEYQRLMSKPYNYPTKRNCWRLVNKSAADQNQSVEVIAPNTVDLTHYNVTMTVLPEAIIVENLPDDLTVRGIATQQNTNLSEDYHPTILEYATTLAERYYYDKYGNPGQAAQ